MSVLNQSGDDVPECPLCMESLDVDDLTFYPCTCGYQICRFCWHRIRTDENGLCPACRKAYSENPADFKPLSKEDISRIKAEKRLKDQQRKQRVTENRKHLANVRVVQKNLVFVVGLPMRLADADVLKRHEYFGKFGKIHKVVINQSTSYAGSQGPSASAYVTYQRQDDALRAIEAVNNIIVDGRTIKTSLGTTKYCSHFMRNQPCPKPDCMYLHDLGDQEASFTKEEMHQGKHQDYEKKLAQSLYANSNSQRKPTPSPPVTGSIVKDSGNIHSQAKEAWPSLQPGQTNNSQTNLKESSPVSQSPNQQNNISDSGSIVQSNSVTVTAKQKDQQQPPQQPTQNNNNKGENELVNGVTGSRRGKSNNIDSKSQAARNKQKNSQNKEKNGARSSTRSESGSTITATPNVQSQINGQKEIRNYSAESNGESVQKPNGRFKIEQNSVQQQGAKLLAQQIQELKMNGVVQPREHSQSESEPDVPREGSTPASTISSSEDSNANQPIEFSEEGSTAVLGTSPASSSSSTDALRQPPPGLRNTNGLNGTQQVNHRSIFQADNNSFFSSNSFQKIPTSNSVQPTSQTGATNVDWTNTNLQPIPDSLPTVYSSEDWQAAFGFQTEPRQLHALSKSSPEPSASVPFDNKNLADEESFSSSQFNPPITDNATSSILNNSPATKFMADFQQNSLQQRLALQAQQNHENCEYIKQNGHATLSEIQKLRQSGDVQSDDDLGFDPFHETQKALAELMENEVQSQQRLFQQQQQQREREEQSRVQQQGPMNLGPHFSQVAHLTHLPQAHHIQNMQVLQQSHSLLSRLPQNIIQQSRSQSPVQGNVNNVANIAQRSRLPPPGFPSSTPNHMNSFGLGIPRPAPNNNTLSELLMSTNSKILPFVNHSSGMMFTGQQPQQATFLPNQSPLVNAQGVNKCSSDTVYAFKDWCELSVQQQQQFHHQAIHPKGWNNLGPIADWTSIDPAIVSSSRPLPFQTSTWQFPHAHSSQNVAHNSQQDQTATTQHWAVQPPPGFAPSSSNVPINGQQNSTAARAHTKFISAGSEIENI